MAKRFVAAWLRVALVLCGGATGHVPGVGAGGRGVTPEADERGKVFAAHLIEPDR